jgi:hypothetical protein
MGKLQLVNATCTTPTLHEGLGVLQVDHVEVRVASNVAFKPLCGRVVDAKHSLRGVDLLPFLAAEE